MLNRKVRAGFRGFLLIAAVCCTYFITGHLLLALSAPPNGAVITIWFPSGITVAALVAFGPWAAVGSFLGSLAVELNANNPPPAALLVAVGNVASELVCYYMIVGCDKLPLTIVDMRSVLRLMLAAFTGSTISACIGVTVYVFYAKVPAALYLATWMTWFGSTVVGVILISPFLVYSVGLRTSLGRGVRYLECAAALLALAVAAFLWQGPWLSKTAAQPVVLIMILVLLWIAFRFPPATMTLAIFSFAISAVGGAVMRLSQEAPGSTEFISIFTLQMMLGGLAAIAYMLASMVADQKRATDELRLAAKVYDTTNEAIIVTTADGKIIDVNNAFVRITGYERARILGSNHFFLGMKREQPEFYRPCGKA